MQKSSIFCLNYNLMIISFIEIPFSLDMDKKLWYLFKSLFLVMHNFKLVLYFVNFEYFFFFLSAKWFVTIILMKHLIEKLYLAYQ